jgi:hypothetical protein
MAKGLHLLHIPSAISVSDLLYKEAEMSMLPDRAESLGGAVDHEF